MHRTLTCVLVLLILSACSGAAAGGVPPGGTPEPYLTPTPSQTPSVLPVLNAVVLPTATSFIYIIGLGDTLITIADRYGVSLEALQAANPGVQPTALMVGTRLIIPTGNEVPGEPTPTPVSLALLQARCWPEAGGGWWCFALYKNNYAGAIENLSAQFVLLGAGGGELDAQIGYGLINVLPSGQVMPLAVHFTETMAPSDVRVQLLTSNRLLPGDLRYLPAVLENTLVSLDPGERSARLTGRLVLAGSQTAETVWVLAVAYDAGGNAIGVRRWASEQTLAGGESLQFDFLLASLGPSIARVEFLVEARP